MAVTTVILKITAIMTVINGRNSCYDRYDC